MKVFYSLSIQRFLLLVIILFLITTRLYSQTTWTGNMNTDWTVEGNWSAGVPDASSDVTIPDAENDPEIMLGGALAKSVTVQTGGLIRISATGTLSINDATTQGFLNQGTVENSGTITIGNTSGIGSYGIRNESSFNNNIGGQIHIDRASQDAVFNTAGGIINNAGTIAIGENVNSGVYGIENYQGNFNNQTGGILNIDRITTQGLRMQEATFTNQGTVNIGLLNTGVTVNYAIVTSILGPFDNQTGGQVNIDRATNALYLFSNTFTNAGTVTIGAAGGIANLVSNLSANLFINNPGGVFKASGTFLSANFANAGGTLSPGYSPGILNFIGLEDFTNSIIAIEVNGKTTAGADYDQLNVTGIATLGGTLALSVNYAPANGDQITILSATAISGTFSTVTDLPPNWYVNYTPVSVILSYGAPLSANTWTGNVNTDWNEPGNWTDGVPGVSHNVIIPNTLIKPVISVGGAVARSVRIQIGAILTIDPAGSLAIDGAAVQGIWNQGTVQNSGVITVGNTGNVGNYGIYNEGTFSNNTGGQINVNRASTAGIELLLNSFSNAGSITIGDLVPVTNLMAGAAGVFNNNTGGILKGTGTLPASNFTNAGGTLSPGYSPGIMNFTGDEDFTDNILDIDVDGTGVAGTNFDQVVVNGTATLGGTLHVAINYTGTIGDQVIFLSAPVISGTFATVTGLPAKWNVVYYPTTVVLSYGIPQSTWTGNLDTDWYKAGNWTAGVPDEATDVTIPNTTNKPAITAPGAIAKSVTIQSSGLLSLSTTGVLTINGAATQGFLNQGSVENSGTITIGNTSAVGSYGIRNEGSFSNNTGGQINIDRSSQDALFNTGGGNVNNSGTITIGAVAGSGIYGIENYGGDFTNQVGGIVNIDWISTQSLRMQQATFTNQGSVNIGMLNTGITVNNAIVASILGPFDNQADGQVNIDRATNALYLFSSAFTNAGTVTIGAAGGVSNLMHNSGTNLFNNNPGGIFRATGTLRAGYFVNAGGTLSPGYSPGTLSFNGSEDFTNSIMSIEVNGTGSPGVNYDQVNVNGKATLGGTLALSLNFNNPNNGDAVTIVDASTISGTFATVTGLPANWHISYTANTVVLSYDDTNTWTGNVNTDWNEAGNWSTGTIPNATNTVIIPNVTNDPVINAAGANARAVHVQTGASLTITSLSTLTIHGSSMFNGVKAGLYDQGTVNNGGTLTMNE